jgi:hypothetical protein
VGPLKCPREKIVLKEGGRPNKEERESEEKEK